MADPCYLNIDDALVMVTTEDMYGSRTHFCHACGMKLLTVFPFQEMTMVPSFILHKSREAMKLHLGYSPADHFEAMGL